jgi:mannose PTS system EIID component
MADTATQADETGIDAETGRITLTKSDRFRVFLRSNFEQGSINYERMQHMGFCYIMAPVAKRLYPDPEDRAAFIKRHMEFFNTHPYLASPIFGVVMALEEERANGGDVDDAAINGVKVGMMGPLAGVGDPVFWGTLRPVLGAFAASFALATNILGPLIFFVVWNVIRLAFKWYTQELGYKQGSSITKDLSGGMMQKITTGASILGMFIMGVLIPRWTSIDLSKIVFSSADMGSLAEKYPAITTLTDLLGGGQAVTPDILSNAVNAVSDVASNGYSIVMNAAGYAADPARLIKLTTLQSVLDQLLPGAAALGLTMGCIVLLRKKVSPIAIIFGLFAVGILGALVGLF